MESRESQDTKESPSTEDPPAKLWAPLQRYVGDRETIGAGTLKGETPKPHSYNHYTISQDKTAASGHSKEKLVAIRPAKEDSSEAEANTPRTNHALQDYQMQLMLLEQQNKKRLMMARQEQQPPPPSPPRLPSAPRPPSPPPPTPLPGLNENPQIQMYNSFLATYAVEAEPLNAESGEPSRRKIRAKPSAPKEQTLIYQHLDGPMPTARFPILKLQDKSQGVGIQPMYNQFFSLNDRVDGDSGAVGTINRIKKASGSTKETAQPILRAPGNGIAADFEGHTDNASTVLTSPESSKFNNLTTFSSAYDNTNTDQGDLKDFRLDMAGITVDIPQLTARDPDADILVQLMKRHITLLQEEIIELKNEKEKQVTQKIQFFYCIEDDEAAFYLKAPHWVPHKGGARLVGNSPVRDTEIYLEQHDDIILAIYNYYDADFQKQSFKEALDEGRELPPPESARQEVRLLSDDMVQAAEAFRCLHSDFFENFQDICMDKPLQAPFFWWYHFRKHKSQKSLFGRQLELFTVFTDWIEQNFAHLYDNVDEMFSRGMVSNATIEYLIRPGDVLVEKNGDNVIGHVATSLPIGPEGDYFPHLSSNTKRKETTIWKVQSRSHSYTGTFGMFSSTLDIKFPARPKDFSVEIEITNLNVVPLLYASDNVRQTLQRRGETFWKCRRKRLISYRGETMNSTNGGQRFMIDFETYKMLHRKEKGEVYTKLSPLIDDEDQPPPVPEVYLFPTTIHGFDLRHKEWMDLKVDQIEDVQWNKEAFRNLVADEDTKELIQALITNKLEAEKNTDMIEGKGNGLIMLLHGSPGTGKTFTAESVAEIAEKPLYPVTCGDIGTKPEEVEAYLESVFHLGKIWGCVVLLDEAEVFLEQRTLSDLKRNALVSVFLRALEYYEGILILTTNRVGTFDEAFKSRIQLALHYDKFTAPQRKQIWKNFFNRLKSLDEQTIDFDDLGCNLDTLASYEMNGRQIRNSITTARQLAQFKRKLMRFTHLKRAIEVAGKFDTYLLDLKDGVSDEQIAREENIR